MKIALLAGCCLAGLLGPASAYAQPVTPAPPPPDDRTAVATAAQTTDAVRTPPNATSAGAAGDADGAKLQEIVVTAQKRAENLQNVPIAVTAVTGAGLANDGITNVTQLTAVVPGLNVKVTQGSFQPSVRGITTSSSVVENPVALYIDGVYLPQQREGVRDLLDVEQLAVLKGPQGTLFGRNATGGVIQITTRAPSHVFGGEVTTELDDYLTSVNNLYVTGGLTDTLAASFSGQFSTQGEGWGDNISTGHDTFRLAHNVALRGKLLFTPSDATRILLTLDYLDRRQFGEDLQPYPGTRLSYPGVGPLKSDYDTYGGTDGITAFHGGGVSLSVDQDVGFARLLSITSFRKGNGSFQFDNGLVSPTVFLVEADDNPNEDYTEELQLISPKSERFNWVAGVFYFHNSNGNEPIFRRITGPLAPAPTSVTLNQSFATETTESVAPFAQVDVELLPKLKLTGGFRYTYEKRDLDATVALTRVNGAMTVTPRQASATIEKPTFRAALDYAFVPGVLGYVSFNTGIKSGGFNILAPLDAAYQPEKLQAYEGGLKMELFDRRLRLNSSAFYYDYTNIQVTQVINNQQTILNGAKASLYGLDVDFQASLGAGLRLSGGLEALHAEFDSFPNAVVGTPRPTGGAIVTAGNASGKRLPLSQKFTGNVALDYSREIHFGKIHYNLTLAYNGDYAFEPDNFLTQPSYVTLNTALTWTHPDGRLSLTAFARNLIDEHVIERTSTQGQGYPTIYGFAPRTYGVRAGYKF